MSTKSKRPNPPTTAEQEADNGIDYDGPPILRKDLPLASTRWAWEANAADYRLEFKPNGWFGFQADCKRGTGVYEINGQHIALAIIRTSRAACARGSLADDFIVGLERTKNYRRTGNKLYFELKREGRVLAFVAKP
jgi:heat shock protein HslJ